MTYAVILAGGTGMRFWPFSRELEPKQFMQVVGGSSLLQTSICRLGKLISHENIYIITNNNYLYEVKRQIEKFSIPEDNIILEPEGKNTAPAIGLAARLISQFDKDAILVVLPSDHYIKNLSKFRNCLKKAVVCSQKDFLVTIGIKPKTPSIGYGYIKIKEKLKDKKISFFKVDKFLEKPNLENAKEYFKDKRFFWNSGIFIWKATVFLNELKSCLPNLYSQLLSIKTKKDIPRCWSKVIPISVDYGIMEYSKRIILIPADFYWTDLGSWDALNEILPKDKSGNVIQADCLDLGSHYISVFSRANRLISTIGLKDIIIVDTPDALLVCDKNKTQDVKKVVQHLKLFHRKEYLVHTKEKRPWGSFVVLQTGMGFKIKLIEIDPKKRLSLQRHKKRAEHWVVVSGCAKVTSGRKVRFVQSNHSIYVPQGIKHRLENPTNFPLKIVEVQTGSYLEEDDIERFEDDYKRPSP
jgi:mannose-1-phosphate guanylyltransferase/mannose-6-phosphate isomerase